MELADVRGGAGIFDRSGRARLELAGDQARWFLGQLLTADIEHLEEGAGVESLLLTPKGRIVHHMRVTFTGSSVLLDAEPGAERDLFSFFEGRIFMTRVQIEDRTQGTRLISVMGPGADEAVREAWRGAGIDGDLVLPAGDEHSVGSSGGIAVIRVARPLPGLDLWMPDEPASQLAGRLQARTLSGDEYETLRIVEGVARFGVDFDEGYLPQEAALERAVHFQKGCYLGQEAVAMAQRGRIKRRIRRVVFESQPALGEAVFEGEPAGTVTSAAAEGGAASGIATLKASIPPGSRIEVAGGSEAIVEELPGTAEGPRVPSARELRERLQGSSPPTA